MRIGGMLAGVERNKRGIDDIPSDEIRVCNHRGNTDGSDGPVTHAIHVENPSDGSIARLAASQRGLVTIGQLLDAGFTRRQVHHRARRGGLHRVHRGVYAVGHPALAPFARELAALLACGHGAVLSHTTAAWIFGILLEPGAPVHVTKAGTHVTGREGIRVHRVAEPAPSTMRRGLLLTSAARTLTDLATTVPPAAVERALNEALVRHLVRPEDLEHSPRLRRLLEGGPARTRSEAERALLRLVEAAHLPRPQTNVRVAGFEVDAHWPAERVVAEVDGFASHGTRRAFERDRARDAGLQAVGYAVLRFTWRQITQEPAAVAASVAGVLARRAA